MIKAKKSLGQNFLIDGNILNKIVNLSSIKDKDILEIGPGTGNLSTLILKKEPRKFFVVEKDNILADLLKKKFGSKLDIYNEDILKIDETSSFGENVTVFGNLPYNISSEILVKWIINLKEKYWFNNLIFLFQKEVADRITAKFNTSCYGRLSILCNWRLDVKKICDIKPTSFTPKPKINSSLLFFSPKKKHFPIKNPKNLEKITRIFFNHRRKMIRKPFNLLFNGQDQILDKLKINLNLRPQNLNFETYYKLTGEFENLRN